MFFSKRSFLSLQKLEYNTQYILLRLISCFEVGFAIAKLKRYNLPGSGQILEEWIQEGGAILHSGIHKLISSVWNKEDLPDQWKESIVPCFATENPYLASGT